MCQHVTAFLFDISVGVAYDQVVQEPAPYPESRLRAPIIRSRIMLEVASSLVGQEGWTEKQAMVSLRAQGASEFTFHLLGGDSPKSLLDVSEGRIDLAIINPATAASVGIRRLGLAPDLLAAIATVPSYDQLGFAVPGSLNLRMVEELAEAKPVLHLSLRDQLDHAVHPFISDALEAAGTNLRDILAWGGSVEYEPGLPHLAARLGRIVSGEINSVFDEGVYNWAQLAVRHGMRFLKFGDETIARLEERGYRRGTLTRARFPELDADVDTVDFSGFMIYTRAAAPDHFVTAVCRALDEKRHSIAWQGGTSLPIDHMIANTVDAPLAVPLHPAAARYWSVAREQLDG